MKVKKVGNTLVIELDLDEKREPTGSGKSLRVASTGGFEHVTVEGETLGVSVNVTVKNPAYKRGN